MPKTNRVLDTLILVACAAAFSPAIVFVVLREVGGSLVELRRGDRDGKWGGR